MGEEVEFGLTHSHVTAIPRFAMRLHLKHKSAPASARSRNPRKRVCKKTVDLSILNREFDHFPFFFER